MSPSRSVHLVVVATILSASSLAACSAGGEPSDPKEKVAAVQDAIKSPSGVIDAATMKNVSKLYGTMALAQPVFDAVGVVNGAAGKTCLKGTQTNGSYDLSCATEGKVTGSLSVQADGSASSGASEATIQMTFENACSGDVCVSGVVVAEAKVSGGSVATTVAFSADVTQGQTKTHLFFGDEVSVVDGTVAAKIALFDSAGDSYVLSSSVGSGAVRYAVVGSNGSFDCSISSGGGQCTGSATFQF